MSKPDKQFCEFCFWEDCNRCEKLKAYKQGREDAINELCKILETKQTGFNMVSMANVYHYAEQMKGENR